MPSKVAVVTGAGSGVGRAATLALLGLFHFFTTGHQAVLSSIQWETAFLALHTLRYPWAPALVALNTFAASLAASLTDFSSRLPKSISCSQSSLAL